jgi:hypothetical protein
MLEIDKAIKILEKSDLISQYNILTADEISKRLYYKIRCKLIPSKYKLDIRYIKTKKEFIYSYQVFYKKPIVRWDNGHHYPDLNNYPHHFHNNKIVKKSGLSGDLLDDLKKVLNKIPNYL